MRRFVSTIAPAAALALAAGCGGTDPLLGTYSYSGTVATMLTQPATVNTSDTTSGTAAVAAATAGGADYSVDFVATNATQHCVLAATRNGSNGMAFTTGQTCSFSGTYNGTAYTYTATVTSGNGVLNGDALMITLNYSVHGNAGIIALVGTGAHAVTATRLAR